MKELNEMVNGALAAMQESGAVESIVEKKVQALVASTIDEALRSYGDFGKKLSEHVKQALNVNLEVLSLESYNDTVLKIIQRMLDGRLEEATTKRLETDLAELLADPPKEIKLSDLISEFIDAEADEAGEDQRENITFNYDDDRAGFTYASWDKEPGKRRFQCAYMIGFHNGEPFTFKIDDNNPKEKMFMGTLYNFDRLMYQIYAAGVKVILDADDVETEFPARDYD